MRQFFKFLFASTLGALLAGLLVLFIFIAFIGSQLAFLSDDISTVGDRSVLELTFEGNVVERASKNPFDNLDLSGSSPKNIGLNDVLCNIKKAAADDHIKGILINVNGLNAGIASIEEIRNALIEFKKSKKFILAYSESFSQGAYYLATAADKIYLHPEGGIDLHGLQAEVMFFSGTLEKLGIKPQVIRHGKFKAAVEPFILDKMSDENREQLSVFIGSIWESMRRNLAGARNKTEATIQNYTDSLTLSIGTMAFANDMVDGLFYYDQVINQMNKLLGQEPEQKVKLVGLKQYMRSPSKDLDLSAPKIAVVYAVGDINSGKGSDNTIGSTTTAEAIRKARLDTSIKAIVLRINSPGGSALASDVIWREVTLAKQAKPIVASMGDVAASGGYYIACNASKVIAQPNTITGSIGVFGILIDAKKLFNEKLGITFDTVKTASMADLGTISRSLTERERAIIQTQVEQVYATFVARVAQGRNLSEAVVDSMGQGRVWSGKDALKLGLVDLLGGMDKAIETAANLAHLSTHRIVNLPEQKEFIEQLKEDLNTQMQLEKAIKANFGEHFEVFKAYMKWKDLKGVQARMPFEMKID
jgi:protease IV